SCDAASRQRDGGNATRDGANGRRGRPPGPLGRETAAARAAGRSTPMTRKSSFSSIDAAADGLLRKMARGDNALAWLQALGGRIVGGPLSREIERTALQGRRLTVSLLDPAWRKPVEATLDELERKLAAEMPEVRPKVTLR